MTDLAQAIKSIDDSLEFHIIGTELSGITWIGNPKNIPSDEDILSKVAELQTEWEAQAYARNRAATYPSTGDQLDYIYHNGVAKWKTDMIDPVKTKYPKG